ncbi:peptide-methionine (R)-S-oxide reductase MsrB [Salegentibacter sp. JZCK2]|uniref:peptide-methionine (R)-S-oxide reductase MsrB n=1 Tax=Salegentibacter tibetensis TaxID=2873600 RepID=UPI001CCF822D|nr:peptide-methionine (R)-S-oxide reductase MsrB [Salegentibacter tibetensis]MBZ9731431.1 peptide-methionine (R)-S-oxide reductase MsrB [Salegentibacter tibetensis]
MKKSTLIICLFVTGFTISCGWVQEDKTGFQTEPAESIVEKILEDPVNADTIEVALVEKTEEEWRSILTPEEFHILREDGTEPAFANAYYDNKEEGIYYCGACGLPIYSSKTKFDSGTGWPSFWAPIDPKLVKRGLDERSGMERTEVVCAQCDSHLGHIFPYPGVPTEERHCLNSLALDFKPQDI